MAISFVGSAENSATDGGNVTVDISGISMAENDLVIVAYSEGDAADTDYDMATVTAGYTQVADLFSNDGADTNLGVFYKFMGGTPDSSVEVDGHGGTNTAVAAVVMVFRGVDTTTPMDVAATTATGGDTFNANPPSINHNNPSGLWVVIAGASAHSLGGATTYTFPTNYTTNAIDRASDDGRDTTVGMGYRTDPGDPEDPGVMTHSGVDSANFSWAATTMALRPAAVAAATYVGSYIGPGGYF